MRYERINGVVDPVTIFTASTFALRVTATGPSGFLRSVLKGLAAGVAD
jgi:hypothetical protein